MAGDCLCVTRPDRTRQCGDYEAEKLYIVDIHSKQQTEVVPDIPKFFSEDIHYAQASHPYVMFLGAEETGEGFGKIRMTLYRYELKDQAVTQLVSFRTGMLEFRYSVFFTIFVLNEDHVLIQREDKNIQLGTSQFTLYLASAGSDKVTLSEIKRPFVKKSGISRILPLSDAFAAVHFGQPLTEKDLTDGVVSEATASLKLLQMMPEGIAVINIRQFFSELQVSLESLFSNLIDSSDCDITYPYMRHSGHDLIYARHEQEPADHHRTSRHICYRRYAVSVRRERKESADHQPGHLAGADASAVRDQGGRGDRRPCHSAVAPQGTAVRRRERPAFGVPFSGIQRRAAGFCLRAVHQLY